MRGGRWEEGGRGGRWEEGGGRREVGGGRWGEGGERSEVGGRRWEYGGGKNMKWRRDRSEKRGPDRKREER